MICKTQQLFDPGGATKAQITILISLYKSVTLYPHSVETESSTKQYWTV